MQQLSLYEAQLFLILLLLLQKDMDDQEGPVGVGVQANKDAPPADEEWQQSNADTRTAKKEAAKEASDQPRRAVRKLPTSPLSREGVQTLLR